MRHPYFHGFFGAPNFGDELLCRSLLDYFPGEQGALVATRHASVTRRTARGLPVRIVPGMFAHVSFFTRLPWRIWQLKRASHLLIGGGGLLQDTFSTATIMRSAFDAAWAVRFGIPFHFVGIEVSSIYHEESKARTRFLLQQAQSVWCRDPGSVARARAASGNERADIQEMPDLAHDFLRRWFASRPRPAGGPSHCVVNPLATSRTHPAEFVSLVRTLCTRFARVTLAAAQPGEEVDWIKALPDRPANLHIFSDGDWETPLELLRTADCLIAERFHYVAAGAHAGLRVVPVLNTAKATHLAETMGLGAFTLKGDAYSADRVLALLDAAVPAADATLARLSTELRQVVATIKSRAGERPVYSAETQAAARRMTRDILRSGVRGKTDAIRRRLKLKR